MTGGFRPRVFYEAGTLRVMFRDPKQVTQSRDVDVAVDLDEFDDPSGIEVLGLCSVLGSHAADDLVDLAVGPDVRFGYDRESDAAAIGVAVGSGTRVRKSLPRRAVAGLDPDGRLVTIEIKL